MTIESATYINDLQPVNPPSTDPTAQGDDHLRLLKQVLQNSFPGATRAFPIPTSVGFSATSISVLKNHGGGVVLVSTAAGAVTATLPSLVALDAGWSCDIIKTTTDANPIFITPPSGNISSGGVSVAKARRCVPWVKTKVIWDGTAWYALRNNPLPIGSVINFFGTNLPTGYEWPVGQTLTSGNYLEYFAAMGTYTTPDFRGLGFLTLDNLGGTGAGRLPSGYIAQNTLGAIGGQDSVGLTVAQIPSHFHAAGISDPGHTHGVTGGVFGATSLVFNFAAGGSQGGAMTGISISNATTGVRVTSSNGIDNTYSTGGGGVHMNLQPSCMIARILVVE